MSQIEELQSRLVAALERIGAGAEALAQRAASAATPGATDGAGDADLAAALEEERIANAQLEERLKTLKARHEKELAELRAELQGGEDVEALKSELETLRQEADTLRQQVEALQAELAEAKAQGGEADEADALRAELKGLRAELEAARQESAAQAEAMEKLDADLQRLRSANDQLRDVNGQLRAANAEGVGDAELVNKAMAAELEGLRATREAETAEVNAVLARLDSVLANARNLPEGEEV